jgi:hypothetical protein
MKQGNICATHPQLDGRRHNGMNCPECVKVSKAAYKAKNRDKIRENMRAYRDANKDRLKELNARWRAANRIKIRENNLRRMGFTRALFAETVELQAGLCAICRTDLQALPQKQVHADHCHATGQPRGVLCHHCNAGLGAFRDDLESLRRAVDYLQNPPLSLV